MADYDSSLPVRTQNNGDVVAKIGDGTTPSQQLAIDSSGRITSKIEASNGDTLTATGTALDVNVTNASIVVTATDLDIRDLSSAQDSVEVLQATHDNLNGNMNLQVGDVDVSNGNPVPISDAGSSITVDGTVTANQGTSPWVTQDNSDGSVAPGTAATVASLGAGIYNSGGVTLTDGQQAALQMDSSGNLLVAASFSGSVEVSNFPTTVDTDYGTVGASTIRTAAQIGNATGAADFNAGATGAQTLRVEANQGAAGTDPWQIDIEEIGGAAPSATNALPTQIATAGAFVSPANPLPVIVNPGAAGDQINDFKLASSISGGASDNHDYTVSGGMTFFLNQVEATGSGKAKMQIQVETGVATGTFDTYFVQFNSTADTNMSVKLDNAIEVAAGVRVRVVMTNRDLFAQDLYSTISGYEV